MTTYTAGLGYLTTDNITGYNYLINNEKNLMKRINDEIAIKNEEIQKKYNFQMNQIKEIEEKEKLLLTRTRMLQISQDRNSYKKKIIYTIIALIFGVFLLTIVIYVLFVRKIYIKK